MICSSVMDTVQLYHLRPIDRQAVQHQQYARYRHRRHLRRQPCPYRIRQQEAHKLRLWQGGRLRVVSWLCMYLFDVRVGGRGNCNQAIHQSRRLLLVTYHRLWMHPQMHELQNSLRRSLLLLRKQNHLQRKLIPLRPLWGLYPQSLKLLPKEVEPLI